MKFAFLDAQKATWPSEVMCDVLDVSRSGYYAWRTRPASAHATHDAQLAVAIGASHRRSRAT